MLTWTVGRNAIVLECFEDKKRVGKIVRLASAWQVMAAAKKLGMRDEVIGMTGDSEVAKKMLQRYLEGKKES